MIHLCIATLIWLKNIPVQHLRSQRTCVLPSTVPTEPLQVSVSVSLTVQVVTPLGVANKLMAPGLTERNRPEEGHFHQEVLSPEEDESSKGLRIILTLLLTYLGKRRRRLNTQSCPPRTSRVTVRGKVYEQRLYVLYLCFLVSSASQAPDTQPSSNN